MERFKLNFKRPITQRRAGWTQPQSRTRIDLTKSSEVGLQLKRPMTAYSDLRSVHSPEEYLREKEQLDKGIKANEKTQPFRFLSTIGGNEFTSEKGSRNNRQIVDGRQLKCRETAKDMSSRPVSAINKVHIDQAIDANLYQFGTKSASANEIEQKIKSHNYIMSLKRDVEVSEKDKIFERFNLMKQNKDSRPYTASALLNDKPQFRITTPNLMAGGGKQSLGDLLSDDQYRHELRQLEVVDDISEEQHE